jgi:hypothetical protein
MFSNPGESISEDDRAMVGPSIIGALALGSVSSKFEKLA